MPESTKELSGRELDAAVAERVMGWRKSRVSPFGLTWFETSDEREAVAIGDGSGRGVVSVWHPSESIEAAMQVVEKMRERGHSVQINGYRRWGVTFVLESDAAPTVRPCGGPSLPFAICRAALAAIGSKAE